MAHSARQWLSQILVLAVTLQVPAAVALTCTHHASQPDVPAEVVDCHEDMSHDRHANVESPSDRHDCCEGDCGCPAVAPVVVTNGSAVAARTGPANVAAAEASWHTCFAGLTTPPPIQ